MTTWIWRFCLVLISVATIACTAEEPPPPGDDSGTSRDVSITDVSIESPGARDDVSSPPFDAMNAEGGADGGEVDTSDAAVPPITMMVGPAGGSVVLMSGAQVIIPAGALAALTRIDLAPAPAPDAILLGATPLGPVLAAGPEGQTFLKPIEVRLPFDRNLLPSDASGNDVTVRMAPHGSSAFVELASTVDVVAGVVMTQTTHFTDFIAVLPPPTGPQLRITSQSLLPSATVGAAYSYAFGAIDGVPPYGWSLSPGGMLPEGLALASNGVLSGVPTSAGTGAFFVAVNDSAAHALQAAFSMTINPPTNPVPVLSSISPASAPVGGSDTTLDVIGTGFVPSSLVVWDATNLSTTFVSATHLAATLGSALIATSGVHQVKVLNPAPGGGTSSPLTFAVDAPNPIPTIASVSPNQIAVTNIATQVTVTGTGFVSGSLVAIDNQGLATTFVSSTSLVATIPNDYLMSARNLRVFVDSPPPGGGRSIASVLVTVGNGELPDASADAGLKDGWLSVSLDSWTGCGLRSGGVPYCWGDNTLGPFGNGTTSTTPQPVPTRAAGAFTFTQLAAGGGSACAVEGAGNLYCWGINDFGQIPGCSDAKSCASPTAAFGNMSFALVRPARNHSCGIDANRDAYCWGSNLNGALGAAESTLHFNKVSGGPYADIRPNQEFTCAMDMGGAAYCWGLNKYGQVGNGNTNSTVFTPAPVSGGLTFATISAGAFNACGVTTTGAGYCWGQNSGTWGALGTGDMNDHPTPTPVQTPAGVVWRDIEQGTFSACGLTTTGAVYCWGSNRYGALGQGFADVGDGGFNGGFPNHTVPVLVPGLPPIAQMTVDNFSVCALTASGARYCWGANLTGELGDGTQIDRWSPEYIP
jgi:hypothetical protein